jgi:hypothetical protein
MTVNTAVIISASPPTRSVDEVIGDGERCVPGAGDAIRPSAASVVLPFRGQLFVDEPAWRLQ